MLRGQPVRGVWQQYIWMMAAAPGIIVRHAAGASLCTMHLSGSHRPSMIGCGHPYARYSQNGTRCQLGGSDCCYSRLSISDVVL